MTRKTVTFWENRDGCNLKTLTKHPANNLHMNANSSQMDTIILKKSRRKA
jgi:hypothetical protein